MLKAKSKVAYRYMKVLDWCFVGMIICCIIVQIMGRVRIWMELFGSKSIFHRISSGSLIEDNEDRIVLKENQRSGNTKLCGFRPA